MLRFHEIRPLQRQREQWRGSGERVALVPTMGHLHAGHLRLIELARALADRVVVTIFVNPLQFNDESDLASYPRSERRDAELLERVGVDALFLPSDKVIYPRGVASSCYVELPGLSEILCGAHRPGHFRGVATVVCKLFNIVRPETAVFGEKDYQQLLIIRRLVEDLNMATEVVGVPTVREEDGLAMSSRNAYLSPEERARAPHLSRVLRRVAALIRAGGRDFARYEEDAMAELGAAGFRPEYFTLRRATDLQPPAPGSELDQPLLLLAAAWLGSARLIDNLPVQLGEGR